MKEKFEHKLVNKIKDVFDSRQAEFNPQDWENLKAQLPAEKSKTVVLFWIISKVAAVIFLILTSAYFLWNWQFENGDSIAEKTPDSVIRESQPDNNETHPVLIDANETNDNIAQKTNEVSGNNQDVKQETISNYVESTANNNIPPVKNTLIPDSSVIIQNAGNFQAKVASRNDSLDTNDKIVIPIQVTEVNEIPGNQVYVNQTLEAPQMISPPSKPKKQKVKFGIEFASFTNYSPENITPSMNYGGGIAAHIPIRKRFSFNPGLVFSAYNLELGDQQSLETGIGPSTLTTFEVNEIIKNDPDIKPSEVHLTGLDIPVNFQYNFLKRKTAGYFVEIGFSSLVYLSENYLYTLSAISTGPDPLGGPNTLTTVETYTEETATPAFKTFDFAKLLNFSVGMDYHLGKRFDMVVNPYLKYPVSSLSSANLKFGSGGLKLKFMLIPKK